MSVIVAPFSNSGIRDWPARSYAALIGLLLERLDTDVPVRVIGTANQKLRANEIVRHLPVGRVRNECGRYGAERMTAELRTATCIVGNNSGIVHLGGFLGVPTVCVFGGTHQRHEWRALGASVMIVSRAIGCSPCQLDHGQVSPYDKACLRQIEPEVVADAVFTIIARVAAVRAAGGDARQLAVDRPASGVGVA